MKLSYYPGCSLKGTAIDYEESIRAVCLALDIELNELDDWNCCGSTAAHSINHKAAIELAGRNVEIAQKIGQDLIIPCPLCFNRLKTAEKALLGSEKNNYGIKVDGNRIKLIDLADFLAAKEILSKIKSLLLRPLTGLKAVCYYGCMSSRPPGITDSTDFENPMSMDCILESLGSEPVQWSYKTDCCGASHIVPRQDVAFIMIERLYNRAVQAGADCFVVSCQMCQFNLDVYQQQINQQFDTDYYLPVLYFTELIGLAMQHKQTNRWFSRHFVDPAKMLLKSGLL